MLIQGIHYAVEEALANIGELASSDPLFDPRRRCLLRLRQNLTDIAQISENIQEKMLHNIISHPSTSQAPIVTEEESVSQPMTKSCGSVPLPVTVPVPTPPTYVEDSDEAVVFYPEPLHGQSDSNPVTPSPSPPEDLMPLYEAILERRSKRKAPDDDNYHIPKPPPAKRPRRDPSGSIYLRPTYQKREEQTSVFGWARRMFSRSKQ